MTHANKVRRCFAPPPATLLDDDESLAVLCGLSRTQWQNYRTVITQGWDLKDGRLHHRSLLTGIKEAKRAIARRRSNAQAQMRKRRKERQALITDVSVTSAASQHDNISAAPSPAPPPSPPPPSPSSVPAISCGDAKPHTSNGQAASTTLAGPQHKRAKTETQPVAVSRAQPAIPAGVEIGTPGYLWDPTTFTDEDWDRIVARYVASGVWAVRSLGPSPRFPECRAPALVLYKHGYGQQAT
jgi:hypothetical protein